MWHKRLINFFAYLPITWFSFEYLMAHGIRPGLGLTIPLFYWVGVGLAYLNLIEICQYKFKAVIIAWFWPIHYALNARYVGEIKASLLINRIDLSAITLDEYFFELKKSIMDFSNYWKQFLTIARALSIASLAAIVIAPLALLSISLITAYFNKMYLMDLVVRWKDPLQPMTEMKDAFAATKLLTISTFFWLVRNEFAASALEALRIKRGIVHTGTIQVSHIQNQ